MCVWVSRVWGGRCAPLSECATEISGGTKCTGHSRLAISEAHEVASGNACMQCHQSFESCAGALASSSLRLWVVMSPWIWIDQGYAIHQFRAFLFEARLEKLPVWYLLPRSSWNIDPRYQVFKASSYIYDNFPNWNPSEFKEFLKICLICLFKKNQL